MAEQNGHGTKKSQKHKAVAQPLVAVPGLGYKPKHYVFPVDGGASYVDTYGAGRSDIYDGSANFSKDATFCFRPPLSGTDSASHALESFNYPGNYVSASDGRVRLLTFVDTPQFRQLSTWVIGQPN